MSVVIAAKNEELHVLQAVTSIIEQHDVSLELIFVDDGSSDSTLQIVEKFSLRAPNLKLFRNPGQGKCSAFNYGVSLASGRYVAIFAGDDVMPQGSLSARMNALNGENPELPVVGLCKLKTLSEDPKEDGHIVPKAKGRGVYSGVSYLFNRPALSRAFPVPEDFPNEDTFLELAVLHLGWKQVHSDVIGCFWRVHAGNSMNFRFPFDEFNRKLTRRMEVLTVFQRQFELELASDQKRLISAKIDLEANRAKGDIIGILMAKVPIKDRLRALAYANRAFYEFRRKLNKFLSGI
ncbi:MAG: glycosyltransferase [Hyphomicrobiaceae bacterium]|nr:glycosyltransferase [Hyphomicrobiaceae bacterium]